MRFLERRRAEAVDIPGGGRVGIKCHRVFPLSSGNVTETARRATERLQAAGDCLRVDERDAITAPMEALLATELPEGEGWQYEPKWDGFRCLARRDGDEITLTSKSGKPLARYFPDIVEMLGRLKAR